VRVATGVLRFLEKLLVALSNWNRGQISFLWQRVRKNRCKKKEIELDVD